MMELFEVYGSVRLNDEATEEMRNVDNQAKKSTKGFGGFVSSVGSGATAIVGGLAMVGTAIAGVGVAVGGMAMSFTDDLQKAMNGLQASTGEATENMEDLRGAVLGVYENNFGENFEEISQVMSRAKQVIGGTADELQGITEKAFALQDTFDIGFEESIDGVNSLMQNFGITSDEAFDIVSRGAQLGANKNGDLITVLSEYSPAFSKMGFSADEFMGKLVTGAESGAFQIDKVGDAMKEFGIRAIDQSDATIDAFDKLGLSLDETEVAFAKGGEGAKIAFEKVMSGLKGIEDPLERNAVGVSLFGTTFEDLGEQGVMALAEISEEALVTEGAMDSINSIKYNDLGSALEGLKRNFETNILLPLGEEILPIVNKFVGYIQENMPMIKQWIGTAMDFAKEKFKLVSDFLMSEGSGAFEYLREKVLPPLIDLFNMWKDQYLPALWETFKTVFPAVKEIVTDVFVFLVENVLPPLTEAMIFIYGTVVPKMLEVFRYALPEIMRVWRELWQIVEPILGGIMKALGRLITYMKEVFQGDFTTVLNDIKWLAEKVLNSIVTFFTDAGRNMMEGLINGISGMKERVKGKVKEVAKAGADAFKDFFGISSPSKLMKEYGINMVEGVEDGVEQQSPRLRSAISKAMKEATSIIDKIMDENLKRRQKNLKQEFEMTKKHYETTYTLATRHTERQLRKLQTTYERTIKRIEKEMEKKTKALNESTKKEMDELDEQIKAIQQKTEEEEKLLEEQRHNNEIITLEKNIENLKLEKENLMEVAETLEEKAEIAKEYEEEIKENMEEIVQIKNDRERELELERRQDEIEHLEERQRSIEEAHDEQMEEIEEQGRRKKGEAQLDYDMYKGHYERVRKEADDKYDEMKRDLTQWFTDQKTAIKTQNDEIESNAKAHYKTQLESLQESNMELSEEEIEAGKVRVTNIEIGEQNIINKLAEFVPEWAHKGAEYGDAMLGEIQTKGIDIQVAVDEILGMLDTAETGKKKVDALLEKAKIAERQLEASRRRQAQLKKAIASAQEANQQASANPYTAGTTTSSGTGGAPLPSSSTPPPSVVINTPAIVGANAAQEIVGLASNALIFQGNKYAYGGK